MLGLTFGLAALAIVLALPLATWLAWLLARKSWPGKTLVETVAMMPLVMPPVATGLILLKLFGKHGAVGGWLHENFGIEIIFTWKAVVIALAVMVFPLLVRSLRTAFEEVPEQMEAAGKSLGGSDWRIFWKISLPLARRGMVAGIVLSFARALGEFGATDRPTPDRCRSRLSVRARATPAVADISPAAPLALYSSPSDFRTAAS